MKGREIGRPAKGLWEQFFKPEDILRVMQIDGCVKNIAEFGCGYGTFTIAAAKIVKEIVYAVDISQEMTTMTESQGGKHGLQNIKTILRDFMVAGTGLKSAGVDYAMLLNILHVERPETLLQEAYRILRPNGKLGIIHWNYDPATPRGPSMNIRPKPEQSVAWAEQASFVRPMYHDLEPYHYGIVMLKEAP